MPVEGIPEAPAHSQGADWAGMRSRGSARKLSRGQRKATGREEDQDKVKLL